MKRLLCMILALLLLLMAVGCNETAKTPPEESDTQERGTEPDETTAEPDGDATTGRPQQTPNRTPSRSDAQIVKAPVQDWESLQEKLIGSDFFEAPLNADRLTLDDGKKHLPIIRIDTMEQFDTFNTLLRELAPSGKTYFESATKGIDGEFMKYYSLFVVYFKSDSISRTFEARCSSDENNQITFNIVQEPSDNNVLSIAGSWLAVIPLDSRTGLKNAVRFDAILTCPSEVTVSNERWIHVPYFDSDNSLPMAPEFYAEALNANELAWIHPRTVPMPVFFFDEADELSAFCNQYETLLSEALFYESSSITEETADMDANFFETHSLVAVYVIAGQLTTNFFVDRVEKANGTLTVRTEEIPLPDDIIGIDAMSAWMVLIPIEKTALADVTEFQAVRVACY